MTASCIYQLIERLGRAAGVEVNPHKFRHTFSRNWLDNGGAEGDDRQPQTRLSSRRQTGAVSGPPRCARPACLPVSL